MKEKFLNKTTIIHSIIIFIVAVIVIMLLFKISYVKTNDGMLHLIRVIGVGSTLMTGQIPPVISPDYCNTWGYAINLFYNPVSTYGPILLNFITNSYQVAIKIFLGIIVFLTGMAMYRLTFEITKKETVALISGVLYITTPYYFSDIYIRGALAETVALLFLPILFLGLYSLMAGDGKKHYYIVIGAVGLFLTHNITFFYATFFTIIYLLFYLGKQKEKRIRRKELIDAIFIILITLFYTIPLLFHMVSADYAIFDKELMGTEALIVNGNGLELKDLFIKGEEGKINYQLGIFFLLGIGFIPFVYRLIDKQYQKFYLIFVLLGIISIFMSLKYFPWLFLPDSFCIIQFPWRMLGFAGMFLSFVTAVNVGIVINQMAKKEICKVVVTSTCILLIIGSSLLTLHLEKKKTYDSIYEALLQDEKKLSPMGINKEYMPLKAYNLLDSYIEERSFDRIVVLKGNIEILQEKKEGLSFLAEIKNQKGESEIEFPYFYYLGYQACFKDKQGNIEKIKLYESEHGFLAANILDNKEGTILLEYNTPISTWIAIFISVISLIGYICYLRKETKDDRKK